MQRDFTYVDDIVEGIVRVMARIPGPDPGWNPDKPDPGTSCAPYRLYNIGNNNPVQLSRFIEILEEALGRKAKLDRLPMQPGDMTMTCADISKARKLLDYRPTTDVEDGIAKSVAWWRETEG